MKKVVRRPLPEGFTLLVVEDNMIVALDVEEMLRRSGAERIAAVRTTAEALQLLNSQGFHAALLDYALIKREGSSLAQRLKELGIPFAFASSYGRRPELSREFSEVPVFAKPFSEAYLRTQLAALVKRRTGDKRP